MQIWLLFENLCLDVVIMGCTRKLELKSKTKNENKNKLELECELVIDGWVVLRILMDH